MESRIRVLLLIACALALGGCSLWPFHRKHDADEPVPVPVEATTSDGSTPAVVEPSVRRRKIKTPQIKNSNFEVGPYIGTFSIEDFGVNPVFGARLAYHISEDFFAEGMIGRTNAGLTSYERLSGGAQLLTDSQRKKAILEFSKTGNNNLTEAFKDNVVLDYAGVRVSEFSPAQRQQVLDLIAQYVDNMDDGHARVKMDEVRRYLDNTWFAWIGGTDPDSVFYYRIHSPVILIEFDHQRPANLRHLAADPNAPNHQHIHVVVRTPNGNDYGKDLLRQHYQQSPHGG